MVSLLRQSHDWGGYATKMFFEQGFTVLGCTGNWTHDGCHASTNYHLVVVTVIIPFCLELMERVHHIIAPV